jgi:hypothetical protein
MFKTIVRNEGEKNIEDYVKINVKTMPDEQALREVEKGNLRPMGGMTNVGI